MGEREERLGQVASAIAIADDYDPNDIPADQWVVRRDHYLKLARAALTSSPSLPDVDRQFSDARAHIADSLQEEPSCDCPSPPDREAEYELRAIAGDLRAVAASQEKRGFPTSAKFSEERAERLEAVRFVLFGPVRENDKKRAEVQEPGRFPDDFVRGDSSGT